MKSNCPKGHRKSRGNLQKKRVLIFVFHFYTCTPLLSDERNIPACLNGAVASRHTQ